MRKLLLIIGLFICFFASAQRTKYIILDSLFGAPKDTIMRVPTQYINLPFLAIRHDTIYVWDRELHYWRVPAGGGGSTELADQGLTKSGVNIRLGDPVGSTSSIFSASRQIATDTFYLAFQGKALAGFPNYPNRIQLRLSDGTTHGQQLNFLGSGSINNYMYYGTGSHFPGINFLSGDRNATLTAMGYHYVAGEYHPYIDMRDSTLYFGIEDNGLSLANFVRQSFGGGSITQLGLRGKVVFGSGLSHDLILGDVDNVGSTYLRDSITLKYTPFGTVDSVLAKDANDLIIAVPVSSIASNIGNSDLTLSANRVLSGNSKTFNIDSAASFWFNTKTISDQQGTIFFDPGQSLIESRDNSTHKSGSVETGAQGTVELTSSLNGAARTTFIISQDSANLIYSTTPSSTSLTGYRLQARNTSSGAFVDFTGTPGTVTSVATGYGLSGGTITTTGTLLADTTVLIPKASASVITGAKVFATNNTYFRPASDNQDMLQFLDAAGTIRGSIGTFPAAATYIAYFGSGSHTSTSYWAAYNNSQLLLNAPGDMHGRINNTTIWNIFSTGMAIGNGNTNSNSTLQVVGTLSLTTTNSAVDIAVGAHHTVVLTVTGKTATLPTAVGITGRLYTIKLTASGTGTVATTSSQTIDGSTTYSLSAQYKYVTVQSDGANWNVIANN